jgi:localization factor PodJL
VEGVRPQARETARDAARRSGMSVGEWLDSVISDSAKSEPAPGPSEDASRRAPGEDHAEVLGRMDEVARRIEQLCSLNASQSYLRPNLGGEASAGDIADVISSLDRRLDKLIATGRSADEEIERRVGALDREAAISNRAAPPTREVPLNRESAEVSTPLEQALMEIGQRQRALDVDRVPPPPPAARAEALLRAPTQGFSILEEQLRQVTTRIETLRPCGVNEAVEMLRDDLAEIGLMLKEAMPRQSIEALEAEVRKLSERLPLGHQTDATDSAIAGVERGIAEIRDALRALTPAENLVGIDETVRDLARKIDLIATSSQDPATMAQLEGAIVGLRGIATHVASDSALAGLSDEVRGLAAKVDQIASSATSGADLLSTLEHRISSMADALAARHESRAAIPGDLDAIIKGLADRLEQTGFARTDQAAGGRLEERITNLVEKLDTSNARLNHLETIESALSDLLDHLERQRASESAGAAAPPFPDVTSLRQDVQQTQSSLENVQGALEHLIDRLAVIESDIRGGNTFVGAAAPAGRPAVAAAALPSPSIAPGRPAPTAAVPPPAHPAARSIEPIPAPPVPTEHRPIDPSLPPDHPLEPGALRGRGGNSPVDRIAASEAALGAAKPPAAPEVASKSSFIAAARRAAQAANSESGARNDKPAVAPTAKTAPRNAGKSPSESPSGGGWSGRVRSLLVAVSVVLIVLNSLHLVMSLLGSSDDTADGSRPVESQSAPTGDEQTGAPNKANRSDTEGPVDPTVPGASTNLPAPTPGRQSMITPTGSETSDSIPSGIPSPAPSFPGVLPIPGLPSAGLPPAGLAPAGEKEVTGSIVRPAPAMPTMPAMTATEPAAAHAARTMEVDKLPAAFSAPLRAAAAKGDPGAQFEIGQRYAEGRGVPQNLAEAADWFDRAARQGLAPAQFRLGGFYEKGFGVKKDLDAARRLYSAAAEAGNAKAMHNLAVLYAEGIDGKPDYQNAAKWFHKAADYGLSDSQYNLGILYGRGIGMEPNLPEAYKWFSLAARDGDKESANKRDDVGGRMDAKALAAAKLAVQAFVPIDQPEAVIQPPAPVGGWDVAAPAPATPKPRNLAPELEHSVQAPAAH